MKFPRNFFRVCLQTFQGTLRAAVVLPPHLEADQLFIKLIGESCVPEVAITEPVHGARERPSLNFARTLIDESSCRYFAIENVGFIKTKVIVEIDDDPNNVFLLSVYLDAQHLLQVWEEYCNGEPLNKDDRSLFLEILYSRTSFMSESQIRKLAIDQFHIIITYCLLLAK